MDKPWYAKYEPSVPRRLNYPQIPLTRMFEDSVKKFPDHSAVRLIVRYMGPATIGGQLTYRQLKDEVDRLAAALYGLGVRKGDRVAVMLPNLPQYAVAFYAALKLGAIIVNTNPLYTPPEIQRQFADAGAETVITLSALYGKVKPVQANTALKHVIITDVSEYVDAQFRGAVEAGLRKDGMMVEVPPAEGIYAWRSLLDAAHAPAPEVEVRPEDVAVFQYTGGTTGVPKSAMLSHFNLVANTVQLRTWFHACNEGEERILGAIPFFHVYGMTVAMLLSVYLAGELVTLPNARQVDLVIEAIHRERITIYPGVPAMYVGIINHPDVSKYDLRSVKACLSGSAPLPLEVQTAFERITGGKLVEGYGLTEAAPVTHANPIWGERRIGIGLPMPDLETKIVNFDTLEEQAVGDDGELWVRGPQVMLGYWNKPEETARTITSDGWLRTGDIARMDRDGYFQIVDRLKDIIIVSGFNVVPREVEEVVFQHPKVQEAVAVGVPDRVHGEIVKAYVVLKPGETATAEEITEFCKQSLAPYKVPRRVEFRTELPRTMVGKVLRRVLIEEEQRKLATED